MTDAEITTALEEWVKSYCKDEFVDGFPGGVRIFLAQALDFMKTSTNVKSESLGDYSITFRDDFPESLLKLLKPYKRARGVGDGGTAWGMWTN